MAYKRTEFYDEQATLGLIDNFKQAIHLLGEDPEREGLQKTPERVAKAMQYMMQGYPMPGLSWIPLNFMSQSVK